MYLCMCEYEYGNGNYRINKSFMATYEQLRSNGYKHHETRENMSK